MHTSIQPVINEHPIYHYTLALDSFHSSRISHLRESRPTDQLHSKSFSRRWIAWLYPPFRPAGCPTAPTFCLPFSLFSVHGTLWSLWRRITERCVCVRGNWRERKSLDPGWRMGVRGVEVMVLFSYSDTAAVATSFPAGIWVISLEHSSCGELRAGQYNILPPSDTHSLK